MKKIEAETLENALIVASNTFECSVVDLEYEIIQNPSKGFLGIGKKSAIICAQPKTSSQKFLNDSKFKDSKSLDTIHQEHFRDRKNNESSLVSIESQKAIFKYASEARENPQETFKETSRDSSLQFASKIPNYRDNKHKEPMDLQVVAQEVQRELKALLELMPYRLSEVYVEPYDENTLYIKIDGEDSALLIGKEGYRYKAISYLIFNWVNHVYGLMIRLEIAEFLRNQEEMIANYLLPTIESIKTFGKAQTKPLDGVLAHIALKQLREQFPDKYVSFRLNSEGERYIIINDFHH